jgi:hypothetical protein
MDDFGVPANPTTPCEGSEDLNEKDATFRNAPLVSAPRLVMKQRIRGALVPMRRVE